MLRQVSKVTKFIAIATLIWLGTLVFYAFPAQSKVDCSRLPHWSNTTPSVNQTHVFCGEWNSTRNQPKGFHSRPNGQNPVTVANFTITQPPNRQGIYGGNWNYVGQSPSKASTMFPDNCQQSQVLNSIIYAATHPTGCPINAPSWANCGNNKPSSGKGNYCEAKDKSLFSIALGFLNDDSNKVNTGFPLRN